MVMHRYFLTGVVHPERAVLSISTEVHIQHVGTDRKAAVRLKVLNNQVAVWVNAEEPWTELDLRNVVQAFVQEELAMVGFLKGYAYQLQLNRIIGDDVDYVFGIDVGCIAEPRANVDVSSKLKELREKATGAKGVYVRRCLADLVSSMRNAEDTGFYCYRAIESLRIHCAMEHGNLTRPKAAQWAQFRKVANCSESALREIKISADAARHGEVRAITDVDRANLLTSTWAIVEAYLGGV